MKFKFECNSCGRIEYIENPTVVAKVCPSKQCQKYLFCWNDLEDESDLVLECLGEELGIAGLGDSVVKKILTIEKGNDTITLNYDQEQKEIIVRVNNQEKTRFWVVSEAGKLNAYRRNMMRANSVPVSR